jgi:hypothetical protein
MPRFTMHCFDRPSREANAEPRDPSGLDTQFNAKVT